MTFSQFVGILAIVGQILTLVLTLGVGIIPPEVAVILHGVLAFIQAITGRVQGSTNPLGK